MASTGVSRQRSTGKSRRLRWLTPVVGVALLATSCAGGGSASSSSTSTSTSSTSSTTSSTAPSPSPSTTAAPARTAAQLKKALLTLKDVPAGFEVVPSSGGSSGPKASSARPACAALVRLLNTTKVTGSKANAEVSFSGGQSGPDIDETLDAMGSVTAAAAFVGAYRHDVTRCNAVTVTMPGMGTSVLQVREVSFANAGDDTFAARFVASSGAMKGFELIQVGVQLKDVVAGLTFIAADPADAEAATQDAVHKATSVLAGSTT